MNEGTGATGSGLCRVLVIEDNPTNSKLCRMTLAAAGHEVLVAADAEQGLALARAERPDIVLMDIQLPGMSGLEATRVMQGDPQLANIPVIALTAHALQADRALALAAGCVGYITTPIDTSSLADQVQKSLERVRTGAASHIAAHEGRVLIVDDEPANVRLMKMKLHGELFEVITAMNGPDAIEKAELEHPDIILLDVMMPGIDGFEVTRRLKARPDTRGIPIVLVTALDGVDHKARGFQVGADEFLNKPVNTHELLARIRSMVQLKRFRDQLAVRVSPRVEAAEAPTDPEVRSSRGQILVIEDSIRDARLTTQMLELEGYEVTLARSVAEARAVMAAHAFELVILDVMLPDADGRDLLGDIRGGQASPPQVLVSTALGDIETRLSSLALGVDDFLVKPVHARELELRVQALVRKKRNMDRLVVRVNDAVTAAQTDELTGLFGRAYVMPFLAAELERARVQRYPVTVVLLDVDDFKRHNDHRGHPGGDEVLRLVAHGLREGLRCTDVAARYGGDEFIAVLPYTGTREAEAALSELRRVIADHDLGLPAIGVSIGGVVVAPGTWDAEHLVALADRELYRAKALGKDQTSLTSLVGAAPDGGGA
ncbi:MAG: response regulator [Myxococcota bacterium]